MISHMILSLCAYVAYGDKRVVYIMSKKGLNYMNDVLADWLATALEVLLVGVVLALSLQSMSAAQQLNMQTMEQQTIAAQMEEYRTHNAYDHTHVYQQDIISAIFKGRGDPSISVASSRGTYNWTLNYAPTPYTTVAISAKIAPDVVYDAELNRGPNGEVFGYEFRVCPSTGHCGR